MSNLVIRKKNEVYLKVETEPHVHYELSEFFCFEVESAKFMQRQQRFKRWDGKIRLYSPGTGEIYVGLLDYLTEWAYEHGHSWEYEECKFFGHPKDENEFITPEAVVGFVKSLGLPHKVRDYQYRAIYEALRYNRRLLLSPTASGKSLMIYSLVRYHVNADRNILIVVPTTSLVEQMYKDFEEYGWMASKYCHKIYAGAEKYTEHQVVITTWQSVYKEPRKWFDRFDVVIGDEAHLFKAKSLTTLMAKLHECKYRVGFTGTLDGSNTNQLVLEGLFGRCSQVTKTKDLMKAGHVAKLKVRVLVFEHPKQNFASYQEEIDWIVENPARNNFIKNLVNDLEGNTLVLFNYVERHGEPLFELINTSVNKPVFLVHGGIDVADREQIREITEKSDNAVIVASYGTFSTGINIRNLHNVIFASPSKSRVRNLQSIGRVLRKGENKSQAVLYDLADDTSTGASRRNYTLNHLIERVKVYNEEKFDYEILNVKVK
jgi:superfamily II DNA or RNA helicase